MNKNEYPELTNVIKSYGLDIEKISEICIEAFHSCSYRRRNDLVLKSDKSFSKTLSKVNNILKDDESLTDRIEIESSNEDIWPNWSISKAEEIIWMRIPFREPYENKCYCLSFEE